MLKLLIPVVVTANLILNPSASRADILRVIKPAQNGQINQIQPIPIGIANGTGVTISFRQSGQYVTQAWLDNPSFVTLNANGCLVNSSESCNHATTVLHLKRINDLAIPGLPKSPKSLLTIITEGQDGGGIYVFEIYKANSSTAIVYELGRPNPVILPQRLIQPVTRQEVQNAW